jgi:hypothetical protein
MAFLKLPSEGAFESRSPQEVEQRMVNAAEMANTLWKIETLDVLRVMERV